MTSASCDGARAPASGAGEQGRGAAPRVARDGSLRGRVAVHGMTGTATYQSWHAMRSRCLRQSDPAFARYGGRGIRVCTRWTGAGGFERFFADMGERPHGTSLDRIDTNGNYEPGNCRWSTPREQANNRRDTRAIEHGGLTLSIAEWSRRTGLAEDVIRTRLDKLKWGASRALTEPVRRRKDNRPGAAGARVQWRPGT